MNSIDAIKAEVERKYELAKDAAIKSGRETYIGQMMAYESIMPVLNKYAKEAKEKELTIDGKIMMDFSDPADITNRRLSVKQDQLNDALLKISMDGRETDIVLTIRKK